MRYLVLLLIVILFANCKKKDDVIISPDPIFSPSVIGSWMNNEISDRKPTFTKDSIFWSGTTGYPYKISNDTIFRVYPSAPADPQFTFRFNSKNDTVTFTHFVPPNSKTIYWRVN